MLPMYRIFNLPLAIVSTFVLLFVLQRQLDSTFPRKRHFRWRHKHVKTT